MEVEIFEVEIFDAIMDELNGRKGFDWWYYPIDDETKTELNEALIRRIKEVLEKHKPA